MYSISGFISFLFLVKTMFFTTIQTQIKIPNVQQTDFDVHVHALRFLVTLDRKVQGLVLVLKIFIEADYLTFKSSLIVISRLNPLLEPTSTKQ